MGKIASTKNTQKQKAAHVSWSKTPDPAARTAKGRKAFDDRFERAVRDEFPDLDDAGVLRLAGHAKRAHFLGMSARSAEVRRARRGA